MLWIKWDFGQCEMRIQTSNFLCNTYCIIINKNTNIIINDIIFIVPIWPYAKIILK